MIKRSEAVPPLDPVESELRALNGVMVVIANQLDRLVAYMAPVEPNYRYPIAEFQEFDWAGMGAEPVAWDDDGVTVVSWGGYLWKRRAGAGRFGQAVWFSRTAGQDENGTNYLRLITFKDLEPADPLPDELQADRDGGAQGTDDLVLENLVYQDGTRAEARFEKETFRRYVKSQRKAPLDRQALRRWWQENEKARQIAAEL